MLKLLGITGGVIAASVWLSSPTFGYNQSDCNRLKKMQTDGSGREIDAKMQVDGQGNCQPAPPNSKGTKAPPVPQIAPQGQETGK
jgi:hypothetical protein